MKSTLTLLLAVLALQSCTSTEVVKANSTPARQSAEAMAPSLLLDIGIVPLDPGIPESPEKQDKELIIPDVRRAESQYIAYQLKDTLELTGNWGAVRVTPEPSNAVDLTVWGEILVSDGERLKIRIRVADAQGRQWLDETYDDQASRYSYDRIREDPFQDFYNEVSNDLLAFRESLTRAEITTLRQVSALRYASYLSPDAFGKYLEEQKGLVAVTQLPADSDRMLGRVERIKEREYLFVDTLDDYYGKFHREMKPSYNEWRFATYEEAVRLRLIQQQARNRLIGGAALIAGGLLASQHEASQTYAGQAAAVGAVGGGIGTLRSGLSRYKDAEIHQASLKEMSQSLGAEITPYVLDIEGRTIELTGTADAQYQKWQSILKDIYAEETGTPDN